MKPGSHQSLLWWNKEITAARSGKILHLPVLNGRGHLWSGWMSVEEEFLGACFATILIYSPAPNRHDTVNFVQLTGRDGWICVLEVWWFHLEANEYEAEGFDIQIVRNLVAGELNHCPISNVCTEHINTCTHEGAHVTVSVLIEFLHAASVRGLN